MIRTQVQLTEEQAEALRQLAARQGVSMAELFRRGVDRLLAAEQAVSLQERRERARQVVGRFASGKRDVSLQHDAHLAEAFGE
jgi:hypothetical protein